MQRFNTGHFVVLYAVLAVYIAARLWGMTDSCLWFDEIFAVHAAGHSWSEMLRFVALDLIHPPLFYAVLKVWIFIGGEGLLWLRLLPVLFAIIAIVPFTLLCNELALRFWPRVLALFLLATNGCLIKYSQEVRMYSLLMCVSLVSVWLFVRYRRRGVGLVALSAVNLVLVYTHYFGWLVIGSELAALVLCDRDKLGKFAVSIAAVFACFVPWIAAVWSAAAGGSSLAQNIGWIARPGPRGLAGFVLDIIEPFYFQASSADASSDLKVSLPLLLIIAAVVIVFFARCRDDERQNVYLVALLAGVPVAIAFFASWLLPYPIWGTRHLIVVFPLAAILIAVAMTSVRLNSLRTAALSLVLLFTGFAFYKFAVTPTKIYSWCNWESQAFAAMATFPGKIYVFEDMTAYHVWFALRQHDLDATVSKLSNVPGVAEDKAYFLPRGFDEVRTLEISDIHETKFWIGYRAPKIDPAVYPLKAFMDAGYKVAAKSFVDAQNEQTIFLLLEKGG
jgi:uncharacterized membrane protein